MNETQIREATRELTKDKCLAYKAVKLRKR